MGAILRKCIVFVLVLVSNLVYSEAADYVLIGPVFTANKQQPWAEAVVIKGKYILYVGTAKKARKYIRQHTQLQVLKDKLILPGFHDSHVHLFWGSESLDKVDLTNITELDEVQRRIKLYADRHPGESWISGAGWLYGAFPHGIPHKKFLDEIVPDRPAVMIAYDGHTAWANSRALEISGITAQTPNPPNGVIVKDAISGEPTGILKENSAMNLVYNNIPPLTAEQRFQSLKQGINYLNSHGIVGIKDAGVDYNVSTFASRELPALNRANEEGILTLRGLYSLFMTEDNADITIDEVIKLKKDYKDQEFLKFGAVKAYVDGVIEARTAALLKPYTNTNETGHINWTGKSLNEAVARADRENVQVFLHAIGDRGVRTALDAFEFAIQQNGKKDRRGNIEHIEVIHPLDAPRLGNLDIVVSMQPLHAEPAGILTAWANKVGPYRIPFAFNWLRVEESGARLAFGSDWSVVTANVMPALYVATTREARSKTLIKDWVKNEAISLENAVRHYTIDGAYASFRDDVSGSLEAGKFADVVVLSRNIFKGTPDDLLRTKVIMTMVGGKIVYQNMTH